MTDLDSTLALGGAMIFVVVTLVFWIPVILQERRK
jgi:hypothetical protein